MAVRERLSTLLERTVEGVRSALQEEDGPSVAQVVAQVENRISALESRLAEMEQSIQTLQEANAGLEKRLGMAMGAIQAATTQLLDAKATLGQTQNVAQQAMQKATSALSAAEAAADGVSALEGAAEAGQP